MIKKDNLEESISILEDIKYYGSFPITIEGLSHPENWIMMDNWTYDLSGIEFQTILELIAEKGLIEIKSMSSVPEEINKDGETIQFVIIDLKGLKKYLLELKAIYPKRVRPIVNEKSLNLIAEEISEMTSTIKIDEFLEHCGVETKLIINRGSKSKTIYGTLKHLAYSYKIKDKNTLLKIIEETDSLFRYNSNKVRVRKFRDKLTEMLEYDGLKITDGKLIEIVDTPNTNKPTDEIRSILDYIFNDTENIGTLKIKSFSEIKFSKIPALIIKYFFDAKDLDNSYKSFSDFNETYHLNKVTSDIFGKRIAKINKRISKRTGNKIKQIIIKDERTKRHEKNRYKWKIMM